MSKKERYLIVEWPESQLFMDQYQNEIFLINDEKGIKQFGNAAYFVKEKLYKKIIKDFNDDINPKPSFR